MRIERFLCPASTAIFDEFVVIVDALLLGLNGESCFLQSTFLIGRSAEALVFRSLRQINLKSSLAWRIKEDFIEFWRYRYTAVTQRYC